MDDEEDMPAAVSKKVPSGTSKANSLKKKKEKSKREKSSSNGAGDSDDNEDGKDKKEVEDEDDGEEGGGDGFASVMSKILNQPIQKKVPVLAKRKTSVMRDIEVERENRDRLKKLRIKRKSERDRQIVIPNVLQNDYERQLKKVATRGGIFLFLL